MDWASSFEDIAYNLDRFTRCNSFRIDYIHQTLSFNIEEKETCSLIDSWLRINVDAQWYLTMFCGEKFWPY